MELYIPDLTKLNNGGASDYVSVGYHYKEVPATIMSTKVAVPIVAAANVEKITALKVKKGSTTHEIANPEFIQDSKGNNYLVISDDTELPKAGSTVTYKYTTDNTKYHATEITVNLTITGMPGTIVFKTNKAVGEKVKLKVAYAGEIILSGVEETLDPHAGGWEEEVELTIASSVAEGEEEPEEHTVSLYGGISTFTIMEDLSLTALDVTNAPDLWSLSCRNNNNIKSLDFSKNTGLRYLTISGVHGSSRMENLTSLGSSGVKNCTELVSLSISSTKLSSIDVSKNTKLTHLTLSYNNLSSLNVDALTDLNTLNCGHNRLTSLDVSKNTNLTSLSIDDNKIKTLVDSKYVATIDLSKNTLLQSLFAQDCEFTTLDVTPLLDVKKLWLSGNKFEEIDVSKNTLLEDLNLNYSNLSSIDVSNNEELSILQLDRNPITTLDVSNNAKLETLWAESCALDEIDVTQNLVLKDLRVGSNNLYELDVTKNSYLETLKARNNHLTAINLQYNNAFNSAYNNVELKGQTRDITPELKKVGSAYYVVAPISKNAITNCFANRKVNGTAVTATLPTDIIGGDDCHYLLMSDGTKDLNYGADTKITYDYKSLTPSELFQIPEGFMDVTLTMQNAHVQLF